MFEVASSLLAEFAVLGCILGVGVFIHAFLKKPILDFLPMGKRGLLIGGFGFIFFAMAHSLINEWRASAAGYDSYEQMKAEQEHERAFGSLRDDFPELYSNAWSFEFDAVTVSCFEDSGPNLVMQPKGTNDILALNEKAGRHADLWGENEAQRQSVQYLTNLALSTCPESLRSRKWVELKYDPEAQTLVGATWDKGFRSERAKTIDKATEQFSAWDGSHVKLVRLVKNAMNDPSTFEHVRTEFWVMDDHIVAAMTYRGSNAFGAIVKGFIKASYSLDGELIEVMDQY